MTFYHLRVKQAQNTLKIGTVTNLVSISSIMPITFYIDEMLINYSKKWTFCHFRIKQVQNALKIVN